MLLYKEHAKVPFKSSPFSHFNLFSRNFLDFYNYFSLAFISKTVSSSCKLLYIIL